LGGIFKKGFIIRDLARKETFKKKRKKFQNFLAGNPGGFNYFLNGLMDVRLELFGQKRFF